MELMSYAARRYGEASYSAGYKDGFNDGMRTYEQKSVLEKSIPENASNQDDHMISFNSEEDYGVWLRVDDDLETFMCSKCLKVSYADENEMMDRQFCPYCGKSMLYIQIRGYSSIKSREE